MAGGKKFEYSGRGVCTATEKRLLVLLFAIVCTIVFLLVRQ